MLSASAVNLIQKSESSVATLDDTLDTEPIPRPDAQVRAAEATLQKLGRANKKNAQALKHDRMLRAQQVRQQKLQPLPSAGQLVANTRSARKKAEEVQAANKLQTFLDQLSSQPLDKWKPAAGVPATEDEALLPETVRAFHSAPIARQEAKAADAEIQRITNSSSLTASQMAHSASASGGNTRLEGVKAADAQDAPSDAVADATSDAAADASADANQAVSEAEAQRQQNANEEEAASVEVDAASGADSVAHAAHIH